MFFSLFSLQQETYTSRQQLLWIDMPWYLRCCHVIKQIPCYFLLFLFPFFSTCCPWSNVSASILIFIGLLSLKLGGELKVSSASERRWTVKKFRYSEDTQIWNKVRYFSYFVAFSQHLNFNVQLWNYFCWPSMISVERGFGNDSSTFMAAESFQTMALNDECSLD